MRIDKGTTRFRKSPEATGFHKTGSSPEQQGRAWQPSLISPLRPGTGHLWGTRAASGIRHLLGKRTGCAGISAHKGRQDQAGCVGAGVGHGPRVVVQSFPVVVSGGLHEAMDSTGDVLWASPEV